jgi:hypothetical protein
MAQKFGAKGWTGGDGTGGIPVSVLQNRIAGKKIILNSIGSEDPSALSFSLVNLGLGLTATTGDQLIASTYNQDGFPVGIFGSPNVLVMLAKLKSGVDSVDFHLVGDSNIGVSTAKSGTVTNGRADLFALGGWGEGIARGLIRGCCAAMYATAVFPVMVSGAGTIITNAQNFYKVSNSFHRDDTVSDIFGGTLQSGTLYAPSHFKQFFGSMDSSTPFRFSASGNTADFAWLPGGKYTRQEKLVLFRWDNESIDAAGHIDTRNALTYRVVHGVEPGSTGSVALMMVGLSFGGGARYNAGIPGYTFNNGIGQPPISSYTQAGYRIGVSAGVTGATTSYITWQADSTRIGVTMEFLWTGYGSGLGGTTHIQGPLAVYLESVHGNTKGWAITQIQQHGGATTGGIASTLDSVSTGQNSALKTIVRETRERQIQAGGSGNLVVFISSGINDSTLNGGNEAAAALVYQNHLKTIINAYKTVWNDLDYPENDLAFVVATTHPVFLNPLPSGISGGVNDWNLDDIRAEGKKYAQTLPDYSTVSPYSNTLFVDITKLGVYGITQGGLTNGNSFNGNTAFYLLDGASGSHLTAGYSGGYAYLAELMITRCLRYSVSY